MGAIRTVLTRLLLMSACSVAVIILLSYEFSRGAVSPRGLGIALLITCIAIGSAAVLIIKTSANVFIVPTGQSGASVDAVTRKRLLWRIRMAKITIATMSVALVLGLVEFKNGPLLPLVVGVAMNLLITAVSVQTVVRLKRILN